jgi:hypothetical protein
VNETSTSLTQKSTETEAEIFSMVFGGYRKRTDINLEPTEPQLNELPSDRYARPPKWDSKEKKFTFDGMDPAKEALDKIYYIM